MRTRAVTTMLCASLALAGCVTGKGREFGARDIAQLGRYDLGEGTMLTVIYDRSTGCEWLWTSGKHVGQMQPRLDNGVQRCDSDPGLRGFHALSRTKLDKDTVSIIRDDDTRCDWIWADGKSAGGLVPRFNAEKMVCEQ